MHSKFLSSLLAFCLLFLSVPIFAVDPQPIPITDVGYKVNIGIMDPINPGKNIPSGQGALILLLDNFSSILLFSIPLIAGISLIIAGYFYIFSSGDTEKTNQGKTIIKWNIVAILVALFSYALVKLVASFFSS